MAGFKRGSRSSASVRKENLDQTLKDLKRMKRKTHKSESDLHVPDFDQQSSKAVRFGYGRACKACSDQQFHEPTSKSKNSDIKSIDQTINNVRRSHSASDIKIQKRSKENITDGEGTSNFFGKLKKFWNGCSEKRKRKRKHKIDLASSKSTDSCVSDTSDTETSDREDVLKKTTLYSNARFRQDYEESKKQALPAHHMNKNGNDQQTKKATQFPNGIPHYLQICDECKQQNLNAHHFDKNENDQQTKKGTQFPNAIPDYLQVCEECKQQNLQALHIDKYEDAKSLPKVKHEPRLTDCVGDCNKNILKAKLQANLGTSAKSTHDLSYNALKCFWEPRNGLNNLNNNSNFKGCSSAKSDENHHIDYDDIQADNSQRYSELCCEYYQSQPDEVCMQPSTETLVATPQDLESGITLSSQKSECNGFLNYKTSPICCSLDSTSASCRESESDIKKTVRCLKQAIALRKKRQKMELNELKNEMRKLKSDASRQKKSSRSSSGTWSTSTPECGSSSSNCACSVSVSFGSSNERVRTVLDGHPCRSIPPNMPQFVCRSSHTYGNFCPFDTNYEQICAQTDRYSSKSSQLKQQYGLREPMWSQPVSRQQHRPNIGQYPNNMQTSCYCENSNSCYERPKNPSSDCDLAHEAPSDCSKIENCDRDPTNWLWDQILLDTPCASSTDNDSIITCYVNMFRVQAEQAHKKRRGCIIDPLDFRYGYPNEKHGPGSVGVFRKGEADVLWSSKEQRKKSCSCMPKIANSTPNSSGRFSFYRSSKL